MRVEYSPESLQQLIDIESYLSERFYPIRTRKFILRIVAACDRLGLAPHRGTLCDDLAPGIRRVGFERKISIYFKVKQDHVLVLGIYYGGQEPLLP